MDKLWIIQCRNEGDKHAALFYYDDEDTAMREEDNLKDKFDIVALESWTVNVAAKPRSKVRKGEYPKTNYYCPQCTHLLGHYCNYCPHCGKKLKWK